jgi:hypothetical protein
MGRPNLTRTHRFKITLSKGAAVDTGLGGGGVGIAVLRQKGWVNKGDKDSIQRERENRRDYIKKNEQNERHFLCENQWKVYSTQYYRNFKYEYTIFFKVFLYCLDPKKEGSTNFRNVGNDLTNRYSETSQMT